MGNNRLHFLFIIFFIFGACKVSRAQIVLQYSDTTLCPGMPLQMCASFTGQQDALDNDDKFSDVIDLGFSFTFFGKNYTKCVASGNGMISFDTSLAGNTYGWTWGAISASNFGDIVANNAIFATFFDMNPASALGKQIRHQQVGLPGNRKFVIEWCHNPVYGCTNLLVTTQMILYEGSNTIEVFTTDLPPISPGCPTASGASGGIYYRQVVQGVRNVNGTQQYFPPNRGPVPSPANWGITGVINDGMKFTPNGVSTYLMDPVPFNPWVILDSINSSKLKWYAEGDADTPIASGACASVVTNSNVNYYKVRYSGFGGCGNDSVIFSDTVYVHFATAHTSSQVQVCAGTTYPWLGRILHAAGDYDSLFTSAMGCDSIVSLKLIVNPLPDVTLKGSPNVQFCEGSSTRISLLNPESTTTYNWQKDGATLPGGVASALTVSQPGRYVVKAVSDKGCTATAQAFNVVVNPNPVATIAPLSSDVSCAYDTVELHAIAAVGYDCRWSPEQPFRLVTGAEGQKVKGIFSDLSTDVILTVFNQFGCYDADTVQVSTKPCCEVFIPNAFTPNGDGVNDYFNPVLKAGQKLLDLTVFDRYGNQVYDNGNIKKGWDGHYKNGEPAAQDVYMYYVKYTCVDGRLYDKKESVTLLR